MEMIVGGLSWLGLTTKVYLGGAIVGTFTTIKSYTGAVYLLTKPAIIYGTMRFTWLMGIATIEWWSGRLYGINCIGEGVNGFYNHLFHLEEDIQ